MARNAPLSDEERQRIRELHGEGKGRNEIAAVLGRSAGAVTKAAGEMGLDFTREATRTATEAKRRTAAERRADLALALLDDAERLRRRMWSPYLVFSFGGRDNVFSSRELDLPPAGDQSSLMRAASVAVERSLRLDEYDRDGGAEAARSMLGRLAEALGVVPAGGDDPAPE